MRKIFTLIFTSLLILTACSEPDTNKQSTSKHEHHSKEEKHASKNKTVEKPQANAVTTNEDVKEEEKKGAVQEDTSQTQLDTHNVRDRATLEQILNGDYTEQQKIEAYNSAVANGVIPQGNVMEGPALAAYESSLRIERGEEKSVYETREPETFDYDHNGVYRTPEEQKAHEKWIQDQLEWEEQHEKEQDNEGDIEADDDNLIEEDE
ncbi:hypothetical protein RN70_08255 [Staphylococcus schleiferi]|uniref:hypothetical protein n=2 Tax=Staphylococcus coagulans TaxID=74706 RepID=UPI00067A0374|nr:hypothetical protein [Staphylococcus coagulans]AKS69485.1 hypothetical protein NP71_07980 [Staphylococcus schleiferi]AKS71655.1 hypothetical protein OA96_07570 [Staphylococcus schleiferi]AKS73890.1 hypothetical protein RN70_08255 [Staphylococcus schleiferi]MBT2811418.1 hypothetical protein [Staphylococcus coagulans]MBT2818285.1 hypothetical protein [Staphylococcus coagulans]